MNIQEEREVFEDKFPIPAHWIDFDGLTCKYICKYNAIDDQALKYQARWEAWLAAKSQAVPEWIEYEKQSPRIDGRYQIFINGEQLAADWESPYGFSSAEDGTAFIQELITHWSVLNNDPVVKAQEQSHV